MSGYPPPSDPFTGSAINQPISPYPQGNNPVPTQPYPPNNSTGGGYPYPYPQTDMSGQNAGYPAPGYPTSPGNQGGYPSGGGGYPNAGGFPGGDGGYPNPNAGGYPTPGNVPNTGGYPAPGNVPNTGGYPAPGNVPNTGGGLPGPGFNPEVCPTAPEIPGYERITLQEEIVMPPTMPVWEPDVTERKQLENLPRLNEDEVREAAIEFVGQHCCYGSGAAKDMVITNITMMSAFHYKLETFAEKRESAWRYEPYKGQAIDGPMNGRAPQPWDVVVTPPQMFKDSKLKVEVPHTAFVKPCHTCVGNGRVRCDDCHGNGRKQCTWCHGRGRRTNFDSEICTSCNGTGQDRCTWCDSTGQVKCKTCSGRGQLKGFVELIVSWTNHVDDYISETSRMPKELVRQVTGQVALEEEYPRVQPIMHASDEAVRNASIEYVNKHSTAFPNERILKQRHILRLIPIGEVNYAWKEKAGVYYVYGYEHKVYFQSYPQKCCCCTIL